MLKLVRPCDSKWCEVLEDGCRVRRPASPDDPVSHGVNRDGVCVFCGTRPGGEVALYACSCAEQIAAWLRNQDHPQSLALLIEGIEHGDWRRPTPSV